MEATWHRTWNLPRRQPCRSPGQEPAEDSDGRDGRWRITRGTAPGRMVSTVDPEARHVHKTRTHRQDGYKAHLATEPETGLYTAVALRPGAGAEHHEATVGLDLLADEDIPVDAFGDTAYSTGEVRHTLQQAGHRLFVKPAPLRPAVPGGFTLDDFDIDTTTATVTCPAGHTVPLSDPGGQHLQRKAVFGICAPDVACASSAPNQGRTHPDHPASPRPACLRPPPDRPGHRLAGRLPALATTGRTRAVVWLVHHGNRRLRYRGTLKNNAWLHTRAAALNLRRLITLGLTRTNGAWALSPAHA
ncbi:transposase [Streptomyces sp. R28]|uniref:Transposase n=1 Tax=Streptomyces sp. R28 TaxID=3238628 RepID=A0AB39PLG5_9ACTN